METPSPDLTAPPALAEDLFGEHLGGALGYARLLATTGVDHGLIGPREVPRLWERHILNCAVLARLLDPGISVGDIGSGAGLPGLAVAIARPDLRMHLIEPLARRTVWLEAAVDELGLENVTVHRGRADSLAGVERFDVVTARAVARLDKLAAWSAPILRAGGELIALKGSSAEQEIAEDFDTIRRAGGVDPSVEILGDGELEVPTTVVRIAFPVERVVGGAAAASRRSTKRQGGRASRPQRGGPKRRS
ncbi:MAG: 16S rRNA (guanine(527)-N(7))-methyltransferase RsmG [Dermatophilus congolensis]|nr:16S rRNA (guanine(527)-N(7))-methyltransferase RsmG [Dermatophilus congolensis]